MSRPPPGGKPQAASDAQGAVKPRLDAKPGSQPSSRAGTSALPGTAKPGTAKPGTAEPETPKPARAQTDSSRGQGATRDRANRLDLAPVPAKDRQPGPQQPRPHQPETRPPGTPSRFTGRPGRTDRNRHGPVTAGIAALVLVLIVAAVVTLALSSRNAAEPSSNGHATKHSVLAARAKARSAAASWIVAQVSRRAVVACDPAMCAALAQRDFPARDLKTIGRSAPYPLTAALVVVTPAVSQRFDARVTRSRAPAVLASFGAGSSRVDVRINAPRGAAAYESAVRTDRKLSKSVGTGLITSRQIAATFAARKAMTSGQVDARLLIVITALASENPIRILDFGTSQPGAAPGMPLRLADLAATDAAAHLTEKVYVRALEDLLRAQPARYRPMRLATVTIGGLRALRIEFAAPSPLGVLNPGQ